MPKQTDDGPGFDTEAMTLPTMDRPSVVFAWFMDGMAVESDNESGGMAVEQLYLSCVACGERVMALDEGDTLRVIFNSALAHRC